ncbi:hypothetical protein NSQ91_13915 [Paenibacillus sp. FSL R7-0048]|uniref:hypothetical protein n=1 Tax=Paenibacillus TaxID=44249 RepID=UPI00096D2612|nr:hypothetical protein [Paenibacillus odorifer]OMD87790.1 hypothetical protein BSK53_02030 [Paenibacillus odorifer]
MTAEEIIRMTPGKELDDLVIVVGLDDGFSPSTNMNDAWILRGHFIDQFGGGFENVRYCDDFPEHCCWDNDGKKVLVWAKTGAEAITKVVALAVRDLYGDFHPWVLFPELQGRFIENLKQNTTLFK